MWSLLLSFFPPKTLIPMPVIMDHLPARHLAVSYRWAGCSLSVCILKSISGLALNPAAGGEIDWIGHCVCTEGRLGETVEWECCVHEDSKRFCLSVTLLMLKLESWGCLRECWRGLVMCFIMLISLVPISWDSRARNCLQRAADLEILSSWIAGSRSPSQRDAR